MTTGQTEITVEVVKERVKLLTDLTDSLDQHVTALTGLQQRQYSEHWSNYPAATNFAHSYRVVVHSFAQALLDARDELKRYATILHGTIESMTGVDDGTKNDLAALTKTLDEDVQIEIPEIKFPQIFGPPITLIPEGTSIPLTIPDPNAPPRD